MKQILGLVLVAAVSVGALGACSHGTQVLAAETHDTIGKKIIKGKTKKSEIRQMFGEPSSTANKSGDEVWTYHLSQTTASTYIPFKAWVTGEHDATLLMLEVTFAKNETVKDYMFGKQKM